MDASRVLTSAAVLLGTVWLATYVAELPLWAVPAAQAGPGNPVALERTGLSIDQAVKMVEKRYHAKVVRRQAQQEDGHLVYVLRVLSDSGHVWTVRVDPVSGSIS
jgi:hypothetical protein